MVLAKTVVAASLLASSALAIAPARELRTRSITTTELGEGLCVADEDCPGALECYGYECKDPRARSVGFKPQTRRTGRQVKLGAFQVTGAPSPAEEGEAEQPARARATRREGGGISLLSVKAGTDIELDLSFDAETLRRQVARTSRGRTSGSPGSPVEGGESLGVRGRGRAGDNNDDENDKVEGRVVQNWVGQGQGVWKRITDTTQFPFRQIGRLSMGCTGTYIARNLVLTAAHCLYSTETDTWQKAADITFSPGQSAAPNWIEEIFTSFGLRTAAQPYGSIKVKQIGVPQCYLEGENWNPECDWGVVILADNPMGDFNGYLGFGYRSDAQWDGGMDLNLAGYPQSKNQEMWHDTCKSELGYNGEVFNHHCDTQGGNSGSGVFVEDGGTYVVGVHDGGSSYINMGHRITEPMFNALLGLKNAYN